MDYVDKKGSGGKVPLEPAFCNCFFLLAAIKIFKRYVSLSLRPLGIFPKYKKVKEKSDFKSRISETKWPTSFLSSQGFRLHT